MSHKWIVRGFVAASVYFGAAVLFPALRTPAPWIPRVVWEPSAMFLIGMAVGILVPYSRRVTVLLAIGYAVVAIGDPFIWAIGNRGFLSFDGWMYSAAGNGIVFAAGAIGFFAASEVTRRHKKSS